MLAINNNTSKNCSFCYKQSILTLIEGFGDKEVEFCLDHIKQFIKEFNGIKQDLVKKI